MLALSLAAGAAAVAPIRADAAARTFAGSIDRVWIAARSVLISDGWEIDEENRALGRIITDPRNLDYRDFGVYGEGTRHRLKVNVRPAGPEETTVTVEREAFWEERVLWSKHRVPLQPDEAPPTTEDLITSRILWLDGLDEHNANTRDRFVYIHGTKHEHKVGTAASHGCVRMRNEDVIELFEMVNEGTPVVIEA